MKFESVIGLEVHAQLSTNTKLWCSCKLATSASPNSLTCPVCLGLPGSLPVLNKRVVEYAIKLGLALNSKINLYSEFSRKNYFYQDLPYGYQITQFEIPIVEDGYVLADVGEVGEEKTKIRVNIERAQIENDTGKTIHDDVITGKTRSFVDFNRAGTPLLEIVTKPDLRSGKEAYYYLQRLKQILKFLDICDGNMEEGSLRCDANVSLREFGAKEFGTKVEVKNMNSFRNVERAINYEISRQKELILSDGKIQQETRMFDATTNTTISMRSKEDSMDYRYFPEPDLIPLELDESDIERIRSEMPELPDLRYERFLKEYKIPADDAQTLTSAIDIANYYEAVVKISNEAKLSANWILSEVLRVINEEAISIDEFSIKADRLGKMIQMIQENIISGKIAKTVFEKMLTSTDAPDQIVEKEGLVQVSDNSQIESWCEDAIKNNESQLAQYLSGKDKLFGFFVGQVMKASKGKANPEIVNSILREKLGKLSH